MTEARLRVGYQGEPGAYSEMAISRVWGDGAEATPAWDFPTLVGALAGGEIDRAVLPVENTIVGTVVPALEALLERLADGGDPLFIVGETVLPVQHCLMALPGVTIEALTRVVSHPVALAQCGDFLGRRCGLRVEAVADTAGAARELAACGDAVASAAAGAAATTGAIASRAAAERYGLNVLASDVQDRPDNATRFWLLGTEPARHPRGSMVRSALVLAPARGSGSSELQRILTALAGTGAEVRCLETRPNAAPWIVELTHRAGPPDPVTVLARVAPGWRVRHLGSWLPQANDVCEREHATTFWAVRGATTVAADRKPELHAATQELLGALLRENGITAGDVVSAVFTVTPDLKSDFPANAARLIGWTDVPLLCATEIAVQGALPRCIRVLLHVHTPPPPGGVRHLYLHGAEVLRPDLARPGIA